MYMYIYIYIYIPRVGPRPPRGFPIPSPDSTRGNCKSQFHKFAGELTLHVTFHYLSRSQWLQLPNLSAAQRTTPGTGTVRAPCDTTRGRD